MVAAMSFNEHPARNSSVAAVPRMSYRRNSSRIWMQSWPSKASLLARFFRSHMIPDARSDFSGLPSSETIRYFCSGGVLSISFDSEGVTGMLTALSVPTCSNPRISEACLAANILPAFLISIRRCPIERCLAALRLSISVTWFIQF
jgi:hypothetical protein